MDPNQRYFLDPIFAIAQGACECNPEKIENKFAKVPIKMEYERRTYPDGKPPGWLRTGKISEFKGIIKRGGKKRKTRKRKYKRKTRKTI